MPVKTTAKPEPTTTIDEAHVRGLADFMRSRMEEGICLGPTDTGVIALGLELLEAILGCGAAGRTIEI